MKRLLLFPVFYLCAAIFLVGQTVVQLNPPGSVGNQPDTKNTIYLGAIPPGASSAPVLVFVHGYSGQGETWFESGEMYDYAYNAGYRTAFVQLGKKDNMWSNGQMLANMLTMITNQFGVAQVVLVAHSKGGVDSESAMIHYGAHPKVNRLITLSTPFYGSQLADLAQTWWLSWVSWPLGQKNDATYVLQTSYMNYFRSITDPHPNSQYVDARTFGAWGYAWGSLHIPGLYIAAAGGGNGTGGNDGVVAYNKSQRPGSLIVWPGHPANISKWDHFEVREGNVMWGEVQGQLAGLRVGPHATTPGFYNPNAVTESRAQIVVSDQGERSFTIAPDAGEVWIEVRHALATDEIRITNPAGEELIPFHRTPAEDEFMGGHITWFALPSKSEGTYEIHSESAFVAIVSAGEGILAKLSSDLSEEKQVYEIGEPIHLELKLENMPASVDQAIEVNAIMRRTCLLDGTAEEGEPMVLRFEKNGSAHSFQYTLTEPLAPGIYNLSINAENSQFRRSIASSLAISDQKATLPNLLPEQFAPFELHANYPNPVRDLTTLDFTLFESTQAELRIYDMRGSLIWKKSLETYQPGRHQLDWKADRKLESGLYIIEIHDGTHRSVQSMLLRR